MKVSNENHLSLDDREQAVIDFLDWREQNDVTTDPRLSARDWIKDLRDRELRSTAKEAIAIIEELTNRAEEGGVTGVSVDELTFLAGRLRRGIEA